MENEQKQKIRTFPACFAWSWQLNTSGRRLLRVTHLLIRTCTMFPCCKCDKLLSSKLALNDHKRKKHNFEVIDLVKVFTCGHCEVSFAKSCNVLRHLRTKANHRPTINVSLVQPTLETSEQWLNTKNSIIAMYLLVDRISTSPIYSISQLNQLILNFNFIDSSLRTRMVWNRSTTLFLRKMESLHLWNLYWAWPQTLNSV